ncbi:MAG: hypothetical protein EBX60_12520, partial [Betaproteobacteria bacterium]|nr:hypothetical protein [Betaproteobacteria bacterium]
VYKRQMLVSPVLNSQGQYASDTARLANAHSDIGFRRCVIDLRLVYDICNITKYIFPGNR